jgi:hypothetical protein
MRKQLKTEYLSCHSTDLLGTKRRGHHGLDVNLRLAPVECDIARGGAATKNEGQLLTALWWPVAHSLELTALGDESGYRLHGVRFTRSYL